MIFCGETMRWRRFPRRRSTSTRFNWIAFAAVAMLIAPLGCLVPLESPDWGSALDPEALVATLEDLPPEAVSALLPLTKVFYGRITSRRFNSRATFEDPSVRQFFPTVAAYSDYYAGLVDAIDRAYIENNRPTVVELLSIARKPEGSLELEVRFIGQNDLPLRWWSAMLVREDEWQWRDGRWWIVPGKV